jgi:hypothetical protein
VFRKGSTCKFLQIHSLPTSLIPIRQLHSLCP